MDPPRPRLGRLQAFAKVSSLLLAAIGVTFIREGVVAAIGAALRR